MSTIKSSAENLTLNADGSGNDIKFQSNAVEKASISDAGLLTTSGGASLDGAVTINESSADVDFRVESNGQTHMLFIDGGNDEIGIKQSNPSRELDVFGAIHAGSDSGGTAGSGGGVTIGEGLTMSGDSCYITREGSGWLAMSGRPNSALYGMKFYAGGVEKVRFQPAGGISFNGDTAAANALDDYEEGTFTPTLYGDGGAVTYGSEQIGWYTKVGDLVTIGGTIQWSGNGSNANTTTKIGGIPFTAKAGSGTRNAGTIGAINGITEARYINLVLDPGQAFIYVLNNNASGSYIMDNTFAASGNLYGFGLSYRT